MQTQKRTWYPDWVCFECILNHGGEALTRPTVKHPGTCEICEKNGVVSRPGDWGWPEFEDKLMFGD